MTDANRIVYEADGCWFSVDPRITIQVTKQSGFEVRADGVWFYTDGGWRKAGRLEALQFRQSLRSIIGEEIADIAGVEPE